jgi:hypothetical protein
MFVYQKDLINVRSFFIFINKVTMTTIHEIQQVMFINTPHGESQALFIIDYGVHQNTIWVAANKEDGKIRHYDSNQISLTINCTVDFNLNK